MHDPTVARHFDQVFKIVSHERFLARRGLGNEVPFFVDPYDPAREEAICEQTRVLARGLAQAGLPAVHLPMFELAMETLGSMKSLDALFQYEARTPKVRTPGGTRRTFREQIEAWIDPKRGNRLFSSIESRLAAVPDHRVVLMNQLGALYPFLRTHTLLNNLHSLITEVPLVVFFPGEFVSSERDGYYFSLFGRFRSEYYRAFRLDDYPERGQIRDDIT